MDYEAMLKKAQDEMPDSVQEKDRFEIPKVKGHVEGNKTIIINIPQIAQTLRRPPEHIFKYLLKELATPGLIERKKAVFGAKISASKINEKIEKYTDELVLCRECGKPDTKFEEDGSLISVKCAACAASYPVKTKL